ncbi:sulfatase-like hydrolase/transferase [Paraburkholderia sp. J10-1]|uniref:sulfatase-like hydrolase/transferase n=1 Tax=Paraburkholderia sp. J10-1 TaxID=2805430 RepID=UPI002AB6710D|nr:sulfatase-like hydrolase/transferase [Paraburkholderia sp. J10-1]
MNNNMASKTSRRAFLKQTGSTVAATVLGGATSHAQSAPASSGTLAAPTQALNTPKHPASRLKRPNILFILTDQERYFDRWPFPVPAREWLAQHGTTFTNHQIAAVICSPSRSTIYTGRHVQHTGVFDNAGVAWQPDMSPEIPTIGGMLQQIGYHSAYLGKWHLSKTMHRSPSIYNAPVGAYHDTMKHYGFDDYFGVGDLIGFAQGGYSYDGITAESAVSWLRSRGIELRDAGKSWFMALNFVNPHDAMFTNTDSASDELQQHSPHDLKIMRPPADDLYRQSWTDVPLSPSRLESLHARGRPFAHAMYSEAHSLFVGKFPFTDERVRVYQDNYFNCIRDCDTHVMRVLQALQASGLDESTVIVFTADHGEHAGAHQLVDKGATAYREQNHVPLIIRHPDHPGGERCNALTSHVDLVPTLLSIAGADLATQTKVARQPLVGRSFSNLLAAPGKAATATLRSATLFNYAMLDYSDANWLKQVRELVKNNEIQEERKDVMLNALQPRLEYRCAIRSVFDGRYRFSRYFALNRFNRPTSIDALYADNDLEMFDLQRDPHEVVNLALSPSDHHDVMMSMNAQLNELIDREVGMDSIAAMPFTNGRVDYSARNVTHG